MAKLFTAFQPGKTLHVVKPAASKDQIEPLHLGSRQRGQLSDRGSKQRGYNKTSYRLHHEGSLP